MQEEHISIQSQMIQHNTHLKGRWLLLARIAWVAITVLILSVFAIALPAYVREMRQDPYQYFGILKQLGLSLDFFGLYVVFWNCVLALACLSVALLIFWRKSNDWFQLLVSLALLSFITYSPVIPDLGKAHPVWNIPLNLLRVGGGLALLLVFYLFPDGQFVPGWSKYLWAFWALFWLGLVLFSNIQFESAAANIRTTMQGIMLLLALFMFSTGALAQIYRYRHVSNPVQRQQSKWVVFGSIALSLGLVVSNLPALIFSELRTPGLTNFIFVIIEIPMSVLSLFVLPLTLAVSILKYRLWDIDVIIRRTLVYGFLTLSLAGFYFGEVLLLQSIIQALTGQIQSSFAILVSTLGGAAIFAPMRQRIQTDIDRRFYRQKYDAEKMLRDFSLRVRDDVDLEKIRQDLLTVVNETLHPGTLGIWVRESAGKDNKKL